MTNTPSLRDLLFTAIQHSKPLINFKFLNLHYKKRGCINTKKRRGRREDNNPSIYLMNMNTVLLLKHRQVYLAMVWFVIKLPMVSSLERSQRSNGLTFLFWKRSEFVDFQLNGVELA